MERALTASGPEEEANQRNGGQLTKENSVDREQECRDETAADSRGRTPRSDLFLVSFLILFFELTCIRWFASMVVFLTFFTNLVLLACFLGMSVGCMAAESRRDYMRAVIPLALFTGLLACGTLWGYNHFSRVLVDVGGQGSPQQIYFGTEYRPRDPSSFVVPIEVVAGVFYVLIALMFVGLGQVMGRAFAAVPNRVVAYTTNIAGSLVGIVAFGLASYLHTSPLVWFAISLALCLYFVPRVGAVQVVSQIGLLVLVGWTAYNEVRWHQPVGVQMTWSPYYKVDYSASVGEIRTNNIGHQAMVEIGQAGPAYSLPHLLNRDAGGKPFGEVLVVGAGSGNDVAGDLHFGASHIDAVEIDPVMSRIGHADHPDKPYDDPRVSLHHDDGRSFVKKTTRSYDLVQYALVDSLVLHSGYSSLRLESFLFTEEALRDIKAKLKPTGAFVMVNYYRQGWVIGRLATLAERVFGAKPIVFSLPYQPKIQSTDSQESRITMLIAGGPESTALAAIRKTLGEKGTFWLHNEPRNNREVNAYGAEPPHAAGLPEAGWQKIGPAQVETSDIGRLPSDDWPFLYLRTPTIPALNVRWMGMLAVLSIGLLLVFGRARPGRSSGSMFFLGAGFMLLETKGVVQLALVFGSTWVVNSLVFFAILVCILLSNVWVLLVKPKRLWPYDLGLALAFAANLLLPVSTFLGLSATAKIAATCALVFVPIVFAGVIFSTTFRNSERPAADFGANVGGAILGGLSENISLVVGFRWLLVLALVYYALAVVLRPRMRVGV